MKAKKEYNAFERSVMGFAIMLMAGSVLIIVPGAQTLTDWFSAKDAPAWVQAVGSVGAILVAIYVANRQHHVEQIRRIEEGRKRQIDHYNSALELVATVHLCASDIKVLALKTSGTRDLLEAQIKLDGFVAALSRVDHLQFDSYQIIAGILSGETEGRTLSTHLEHVIKDMIESGRHRHPFLVERAGIAESKLAESWDSMNAKVQQISEI